MSSAKAGSPGCRALARPPRPPSPRVPFPPPPVASYQISCRLDTEKKTVEGTEVLTWTNTTSRPASTAPVPPLPERLPEHALDLLAGVPRREPRREAPAGLVGLDRDPADDRLRRRRPSAASLKYIAPDDGNPNDRTVAEIIPARPVAPGETISVALDFVSRLPRVAVRTGYKGDFFFVAQWFPKIGVFRGDRLELPPVPRLDASFSPTSATTTSRSTSRRDSAARSARPAGASRSGRPPEAASSTGSSRRASTTSPGPPTPHTSSSKTLTGRRASVTCASSCCSSPSTPRRPSVTFAPPKPRSRATAACSASTRTARSRSSTRRGERAAPAGWSTRRSSPPGPRGAPAQHPPARGGHGPRDGPPVLLRPHRLERVRGGVARRRLQHLYDGPRDEVGLRPEPRRAERFRPPLPARHRDPLPARRQSAILRGRRLATSSPRRAGSSGSASPTAPTSTRRPR